MFRKCVVFIDDDIDILNFFKTTLSQSEIETHCFLSPGEALKDIEEIFPGLVFIDYQMAETNGLALLEKLKKILPFTKTIMLTGEGNERIAVKAMKTGADDYFVKPMPAGELLKIIDRYLTQFHSLILDLNQKYDYPWQTDVAISRYEFLRAAFDGKIANIKTTCHFFTFSRQDFYNYEKRFKQFGVLGLLKKKDFEKLPPQYQEMTRDRKHLKDFNDFFCEEDELQKKLEMLREAAVHPKPNICEISQKYGFTRESFYQIYRRFQKEGVLALIEKKKGRPRINKP